MRKFIAAGAVAAASVGIVLGGTGVASAASNTIASGEGVYRVGYDIRPGTYTTQGALNGYQNCFWARANVGPYGVIPIAYGETQIPTTVTIDSRDGAFITSGCSGWVRENDGPGSLDSGSLTGSLDTGSLTGSLAGSLIGGANNGSVGSLAGGLLGSLFAR
ncbi:hypothetical protein [Rhodococcus sp. ACT016]|uniref:hypothetical protein n=1 Tax=Rhodococcus sp. ACT016 TaxID=3134808 RepID=UPI003D2816E2